MVHSVPHICPDPHSRAQFFAHHVPPTNFRVRRLDPVVALWNDVRNLNVTPKWLNRSKGHAFAVWKDGREKDLRSALCRYNIASNHRAKICVAFEEATVWMQRELHELAAKKGCDIYGELARELERYRDKTG